MFWSPHGALIANQATEDDFYGDVIIAHADGSGTYRLLDGFGAVQLLEWRPDGRLVYAFTMLGV